MHLPTCLGFHVECGTMLKGIGVTVMGFILFIGSVYLLLSAVLGRWMAYLLTVVAFAGWMLLLSVMWLTGYGYSQGPVTPKNLGPQGQTAAWVPLEAGLSAAQLDDPNYAPFTKFPGTPWQERTSQTDPSVQAANSVALSFLALQANAARGIYDATDLNAITSAQFTVDHVAFASAADGKTSLAVVVAHYASGGPRTEVAMYHNNGSVPRYSYYFLIVSLLLIVTHLPLLDKAEKRRKAFLTGGAAPAWYGPA
ncbi:MAG: hypothetical protein ABI828_04425 [Actinomycetota bacterium]